MFKKSLMLFLCLGFFMVTLVNAQGNQYVGVAKCKMCHSKDATGNQYKVWSESAHANAFKTLSGEKAIAAAKKLNITNPQTNAKCLKCHITDATIKEEGVSCEACHGAGSAYKSMTTMKDRNLAIKAGLVIPNEKTCVKCHNSESPTFKSFDFASFNKKIAHMAPKK